MVDLNSGAGAGRIAAAVSQGSLSFWAGTRNARTSGRDTEGAACRLRALWGNRKDKKRLIRRNETRWPVWSESGALALCTAAVYRGALKNEESQMVAVKQRARKARGPGQPRASITFPPELYQTLEDLAKRKKVSLAWVVREAAEKYVEDQWPLFAKK